MTSEEQKNNVSQWYGGKPSGCLNGLQVCFTHSTGLRSKLFRNIESAILYKQVVSDAHGLTKNKYRVVTVDNKPYLEVQLQDDHIMKCELEHLPLVEERIWTANKGTGKYCWYAKSRASKKREQEYCLFHRHAYPDIKEIDHINRDGLDNRRCNIREGAGRVNANNKRKQKNNTSGHTGVRFEGGAKARWKVQWIDKESGKRRTKSFSVAKYGEEDAKKLAIAYREEHAPCAEDLCNYIEQTALTSDGDEDRIEAAQNKRPKHNYKCPSGKIIKLEGYEPRCMDILLKEYTEESIYTDPEKMPEIWYLNPCTNRKARYFPDMYLHEHNIVVEVKSTWTLFRDLERNLEKFKCAIEAGLELHLYVFAEDYLVHHKVYTKENTPCADDFCD